MRFVTLALCLFPCVVFAADLVGKPRILDGNTIEIDGEQIRLHGIDAPEPKQICHTGRHGKPFACGTRATRALQEIVRDQSVTCRGDQRDDNRRLVAKCFIGRIDIGEQLVLRGWAVAYRRDSEDYVRAEEAARRTREGLWRHKFVMPWDWRQTK